MTEAQRTLAIFDFDGTLIKGDSLWPFLAYACGWPRVAVACLKATGIYIYRKLNDKNAPELADRRSFMKAYILLDLLGGKTLAQLEPAMARLQKWVKWNPIMRRALLDHQAKGHEIVIASGGLDIYLPALLKGVVEHYTLICTEMESIDRMLTGHMCSGNCVRQVKAERVAAYLQTQPPFDDSWGYGNDPHDVPMLELVKHRIIV